jgi:hypothetical protein
MADTAEVEVKLDTSRAMQALSGLMRQAGTAAKSIGSTISDGIRGGIGIDLSPSNLIGQARGAFASPTNSAASDILSEVVSPFANQFMGWALGDLKADAAASQNAREATIQAFGMQAGQLGKTTPMMRSFFDNMRTLNQTQEHGRMLFERDPMFHSDAAQLVDKVIGKITDAIDKGFDKLIGVMNPANWI